MSAYYPSGCTGGTLPVYSCNPCPTRDFARIRSVALYKGTFTDPSNPVEWATKIAAGDARVIWQTSGSYDGGTTQELPGYGNNATANGSTTHSATVKDPNYYENCDFYNSLRGQTDWKFAYLTKNYLHLSDATATYTPKNPVAEDINATVEWQMGVKWSNDNNPCPVLIPAGIFDRCYIPS
jgi:hypothetical protein